MFCTGEAGHFPGEAVEFFCLPGIHLVECRRRNAEVHAQGAVQDGTLPPEYDVPVSQHHAGAAGIDVLDDGGDLRKSLADCFHEVVLPGKLGDGRDQDQHDSLGGGADHDVADEADAGVFVIDLPLEGRDHLRHRFDDGVCPPVFQQTSPDRDHMMGVFLVDAPDRRAFRAPGQCGVHLVPIVERVLCAQDRFDPAAAGSADGTDAFPQECFLSLQLAGIRHAGVVAAAAFSGVGTVPFSVFLFGRRSGTVLSSCLLSHFWCFRFFFGCRPGVQHSRDG